MPRRPLRASAPAADTPPYRLLRRWLRLAHRAGIAEPEAMVLATADRRGSPSARVVLLRGLDPSGLVFFTNYRSRKGRELSARPRAAVVFYWHAIGRQVRAEGPVTRLDSPASDLYFAARPRAARLAAWASPQSRTIPDRGLIERRFRAIRARFRDRDVPRPPHWGGFRLEPRSYEFWRNRPHRLHDRLRYTRRAGTWTVARLAP